MVDVNPDKDIHSDGPCILSHYRAGTVDVYDRGGAWAVALTQLEITCLADRATSRIWEQATFSDAVRGLLHKPLKDRRTMTQSALFKTYLTPPDLLIQGLMDIFQTQTEWFASPLDRHSCLPHYASAVGADRMFLSIGCAYTCQWLGSGWINPGLHSVDSLKALKWAIASCYEAQPVFNLLLLSHTARLSGLHHWLQHPCVQKIVSIPRGCCPFRYHLSCIRHACRKAPCLDLRLTS